MRDFEHAGYLYAQINKGMYRMAQAGLIANELLAKMLAKNGFKKTPYIPGLWKHHANPIQSTLVVDKFGIKYEKKQDAQDIINALGEHYEAVSVDWDGELLCGIKLEWDYQNRTVDLSMPGYITKLLQHFLHPTPNKPYHQPHSHVQPQYGMEVHLTKTEAETPLLQPNDITKLPQIIGTILYYARAVYGTLTTNLNELASSQSKVAQSTMQDTKNLVYYCHTHSNATIRYFASQMKLHIHSNASYLSAPKERSRVGEHLFLSDIFEPTSRTKNNRAVLVLAATLRHVMASAVEAELGGLLINAKEGGVLRTSLEEMGHP